MLLVAGPGALRVTVLDFKFKLVRGVKLEPPDRGWPDSHSDLTPLPALARLVLLGASPGDSDRTAAPHSSAGGSRDRDFRSCRKAEADCGVACHSGLNL